MNRIKCYVFFSFILLLSSCATTKEGFNLFTPEQDIQLGQEVSKQIESDPEQFPLLPERGNEEVYRYIRNITNKILNTGKVSHREDFAWEVKIINKNDVLNAFATPGGYIYVYTGLIKFLDSEDQLAGVMGHEIAHAAQRHSTRQMTKVYGIAALTSVVTGNADPGLMEQIALSLLSLKFGRAHETESDMYSVIYLCETDYNAAGAAGFFKKIDTQSSPPAFLSTHPDPGNRIEEIEKKAKDLGCTGSQTYQREYDRIKSLLR